MEGLEVGSKAPAPSELWPFHILICDSLGFGLLQSSQWGLMQEKTKLNQSLMLKYQRETNLSPLEMILGCKRKPGCVP